ncbi:MAG: leucine-rich repeat protein, partial [Lachnospiraceae bacterium]
MRRLGKRVLAIALATGITIGMMGSDAAIMNAYAMGTGTTSEIVETEETTVEEIAAPKTSEEEPGTEEPSVETPTEEETTEETSTTEEYSFEETETEEITTEETTTEEPATEEVKGTTVQATSTASCELGIDENGVLKVVSGDAKNLSGTVTIPTGTKVIPSDIFENNTKVAGIRFATPVELAIIEDNAFSYSGIKEITIPKTVTTIGKHAFSASSLEYLGFESGGSLVEIGDYAFASCNNLDECVTNKRFKTIGSNAFQNCTKLDNRISSSGVEFDLTNVISIGDEAFIGCTALTFIEIPGSVTTIGTRTFKGCTALGKSSLSIKQGESAVTMKSGVTTIGESAFEGCTGLKKILLPASLNIVEAYAFEGCNNLTSIKSENAQGENGSCEMTLHYNAFPFLKGLTLYSYAGDIEEWVGDHTSYGILYKSLYVKNAITVKATTHGTVTANVKEEERGKRVYLTVTPEKGYVLNRKSFIINDGYGNPLTPEDDNSFIMPATWVEVYAEFIAISDVDYGTELRLKRGNRLSPAIGEANYDSEVIYIADDESLNFTKPGKKVRINVEGDSGNQPNCTELEYKSSNSSIVSIDSYGTVTALKEGTATLTVSLKENPKNVKPLSIKVKVGAKTFVTALSFDYQADSRINIEKVEDEGSEAAYIGYDLITVRSSLVNAQEKKLVVTPIGIDSEGDSIIVPYTWSCLDTNIVQLSSTATTGKSNTLTLKKGVVGETVITVKTKQVAKGENAAEVERKFIIRIVDDTPRLAEDKLVVDPLSDTGTPIELVSNYENEPELTDVKIVELITNTKPISYSDEKIKDVFEIVLEDGKLYLKAKNPEKYTAKKDYPFKNCYLQGTLQGTGKIYQIPITSLTICKKEIKPAFSISGKLNLFYNGYAKEEEIGKVTVTSKNKDLTIERCELVGINPQTDVGKTDDGKFANNFTITPISNDGKLYITRTQNDMATYDSGNNKGKPVLSGYIKINYVGYDSNFYYKITVPTSTVAPTYTLAPATITLNSLAENQVKTVQFINKKTKKPENITADTVITMDRSDSGTTVNVKEIESDDINIDSDT